MNDKLHKVKKIKNKLKCDCGDDLFFGIPCCHLIAVSNKLLETILMFCPSILDGRNHTPALKRIKRKL